MKRSLKKWHATTRRIEEALRDLHLVGVEAKLYTDDHPKFQASVKDAVETWGELLEDLGEVELKRIGSDLVYQDMAMQSQVGSTREFVESLEERDIECLVFRAGMTYQELMHYTHYMRLSEDWRREVGGAGRYLRNQGVRHIEVHRLEDLRERRGQGVMIVEALRDVRAFRGGHLDTIQAMYREARVARSLDLDSAWAVVDHLLKECTINSSLMLGICSIKGKDPYTCTHSLNTCVLSMSIANYIGLDEAIMPVLGIACLLHDIGKMFVPNEILNKPGRLTREEWDVMEHHTTYGARFLLGVPNLPALAPLVAYEHHMNLKGTGYPRPRRPYTVNMISLMVTIADFYDALSTARSYKKAIPPAKVVEILGEQEEGKMEPLLRELFIEMVGRYPIGTVVRLDTGELGVVSMQNREDVERPEVFVVSEPDGRKLDKHVSAHLSERGAEDAFVRSIVEAVDPEEVEVEPLAVLQSALRAESE